MEASTITRTSGSVPLSLTKILPAAKALLKPSSYMVCLIKPQFEAGREKVGKKGVVSDFKVHEEVVEKIESFAASIGFLIAGLDFSPIKGPEGNIEYLLYIQNAGEEPTKAPIEQIAQVVAASKAALYHKGTDK